MADADTNGKKPLDIDEEIPPESLKVEAILSEFGSESRVPPDPIEELCGGGMGSTPSGMVILDERAVTELLNTVQTLREEVAQLRTEVRSGSVKAEDSPVLEESGNTSVKKRDNKAGTVVGNILFYGMLIALVLGAFLLKSNSSGAPFTFAGHAAFTVLTSSMEDTYPKGSLVVTKSVDANGLQIGDDITFMISESASVTHRIVGIIEDYQGTGQRAFETQGTMNENPDKEPAVAANVVGKVIFCSVILGQAAAFITKNWPMLLFSIAVLVGLITFLKWNMKRSPSGEHKKPSEMGAEDSTKRRRQRKAE